MERRVLDLDEATLRRRTSIKWQKYPSHVLPLWLAEMDALPAPTVREELRRIADDGDLGYPVLEPLLDAVATTYARWGATLDRSRMHAVTDVMTGMRAGLCAFTSPGDPVYITTPVYPPFHMIVGELGRRLVPVPLGADGRLHAPALGRAFDEHGEGALLLSNPHNPSGTVPTPQELTDVARVARRHGVGVVCDEVHAPLVLPGAGFTPWLSLPDGQAGIAVFSAAKGWNLAGLKSAVLVGGSESAQAMSRLPPGLEHTTSHVAARAHTAALVDGVDWLGDLVADLDANRTLLAQLIADHLPRVAWAPVEATYLAWLDCRDLGLGPDPSAHFREVAGVALMSGLPFGEGEGFARLNFATSPALLTEAIRRMAASLDRPVT